VLLGLSDEFGTQRISVFEPFHSIWQNAFHEHRRNIRMLLQTNSYIVPKDKRVQHARLVQRFRQTLTRLGCDHFEAYEQVGANWSPADTTGRFVQLMRFRDRKHQLAVQGAERNDPIAQGLIKEFCELINFPYQQQQGLFAVGFYHSLLPTITPRATSGEAHPARTAEPADDSAAEQFQQHEDHLEPVAGDDAAGPTELANFASTESINDDASDELPLSSESEQTPSAPGDSDSDALLDEMESGDEPADFIGAEPDLAQKRDLPRVRRQSEPG
jgi:hypothetical protein